MVQKVKHSNNIISKCKMFVFTTLAAALIAVLLLLVSAVLLEKLGLNSEQARLMIYAVYIISGLAAGLLAGKWKRERKFVWGALAGLVWLLVVLIISLCMNQASIDVKELFPAIFCMVGGGMLGGMLA